MAAAGVAAALPSSAYAEGTSLFDMFNRNRVLRDTDREANAQAALATLTTSEPTLSYDTAFNLQNTIAQYEPYAAAGGWEIVPQEVYTLTLGNIKKSVVNLKRRLIQSGDMPQTVSLDDTFDGDTDKGLRTFQARHGLIPNGQVDEQTYYALIVPADIRLQQLKLNLARVTNLADKLSDKYVVINIPAALIEAVDMGTVTQRHTGVVGRVDRQTPIMKSKVTQINFNPYWHVPKSIIEKDLIPYMQKNPNYLTEQNIKIYDGNGQELQPTQIDWNTTEAVQYMFRQEPGSENAMGHVKINFTNPYDCYLHDTPNKALFGENARFHSSGCVRVGEVQTLVGWLLNRTPDWDQGKVDAAFTTNERADVTVKEPPALYTTYITAWANKQGTVSFRDDVYGFDAEGRTDFTA